MLKHRKVGKSNWSIFIFFLITLKPSHLPAQPLDNETLTNNNSEYQLQEQTLQSFEIFPTGINIGNRNVVSSTLVRGAEDGEQPINFDQWQIPISEVIKVLDFQKITLPDGQWELRNIGLYVRVNPNEFPQDPLLGTVISISQIRDLFDVSAEFDFESYAICLNPPWLDRRDRPKTSGEVLPIILDGLPQIKAPDFSLSVLSNNFNYTTTTNQKAVQRWQGQTALTGRLLGGSFYLNTTKNDLIDSWHGQLTEAQYFRQTPSTDFALGSQAAPFSDLFTSGHYWGVTTTHRFGYTSSANTGDSGFNMDHSLRSDVVLRDIQGQTLPGTLVQLVRQNLMTEILAEVLVDESGEYRFEHVPTRSIGSNTFQLLFYPDGILTHEPIIKNVDLYRFPEHLSTGNANLIFSTGWQRETEVDDFLGSFSNWQTSANYRLGLNNSLTVGLGGITTTQAGLILTNELFFQPQGMPIRFYTHTAYDLNNKELDYDFSLQYAPSNNFELSAIGNRDSQIFQLNIRPLRGINFDVRYDTKESQPEFNGSFYQRLGKVYLNSRFQYKDQQNYQLQLRPKLGDWELDYLRDEFRTNTKLTYTFAGNRYRDALIWGDYQRQRNNDQDYMGFGWQFVNKDPVTRQRKWGIDLGYRFNDQSSGVVASFNKEFRSGLSLRLDYSQVALFSESGEFRLQLHSNLNLQPRLKLGREDANSLRGQGGILLRAFIDRNENGLLDGNEQLYTDSLNELLILNNRLVNRYRTVSDAQGLSIPLTPDTYRVDLDPAGYPFDTTPAQSAMAVEVKSGAYTEVVIPFSPSYTIVGVVRRTENNSAVGAKVEAVNTATGDRRFSITNNEGVYFLEGLKAGKYEILIDNVPTTKYVTIHAETEQLIELNFTLD